MTTNTPCLGYRDSLRFVTNPSRFLEAGRRLGPVWRFWFPGTGRNIHVVSHPRYAAEVLQHPELEFYRPEAIAPWIGEMSPLLTSGPVHSAGRALAITQLFTQARVDPQPIIAEALNTNSHPIDLTAALYEAAMTWSVRRLQAEGEGFRIIRKRLAAWMEAANTPALVVPQLRPFSRRWRALAKYRAALELALLEHLPSGTFGHADDELRTHVFLTLFAGSIDNPALLAAHACLLDDGKADPDHVLRRALDLPPIPLALREATKPTHLADVGLHLEPGEAIAVDLAASRMPFSYDRHACIGAQETKTFVRAAISELRRFRVQLTGVKWGRSRLSYGPTKVLCAPR